MFVRKTGWGRLGDDVMASQSNGIENRIKILTTEIIDRVDEDCLKGKDEDER